MGRVKRKGSELNLASDAAAAKRRCQSDTEGDKNETSQHCVSTSTNLGFFNNMAFFIVKAGIEKTRFEIFKNQITKYGGSIVTAFKEESKGPKNSDATHIIVDDKMEADRFLRLLHLKSYPLIPVIKSTWLSKCLRQKTLLPYEYFMVVFPSHTESDNSEKVETDCIETDVSPKNEVNPSNSDSSLTATRPFGRAGFMYQSVSKSHVPTSDSDSDYVASDDDKEISAVETSPSSTSVPVDKWICAQSSKNPRPNLNSHITDKLEEMVKAYESTNDKWRAFGYQKAIQALRRHPKKITTWEEAMNVQGVGKRLADKIREIVDSGQLRKLQELKSSEEVKVMEAFTNVWGAGPTTAHQWYQQGFRTIDDLNTKAHLTHQQQVGVRLYEDLLDRMPREEAGKIEQIVRETAESIQAGIVAQACGSYRRGKVTCGDVDVLVTHPDGKSHKGIFARLLAKLKESGFLTDDLVSAEDAGNQKKYLGVCKLPGPNTKHRRLDIIVVPYSEYSCALVYFTGSAHFNRSLRHLCKKQNMSLNEHALKTGVVRKGTEKIYEGTVVPTPTEESVFAALKVPFRPPEERDH